MQRIPTSTYRLQFNYLFTFKQAIKLVDYWHQLGISHIYASPITKARSKSLYGYDVVDHTRINPEIGTAEEFVEFSKRLKNKNISLILDIVPNHMCISDPGNLWWKDVLENGPGSIYAGYFDILWDPPKPELKNKIFLPILSQPLGKAIENQEIQILYREGTFYFECAGAHLPVNPNSWATILKFVDSDRLASLDDKDEDLLEFESIVTALDHLPLNSDRNSDKCKEHDREKEVIKKRLNLLFNKRKFFSDLIQSTLLKLNGEKEEPQSFNGLESILKEQSYRLSDWRLSNDLINYRRFFDINDLACLHVEKKEVFDAIHPLIFELLAEGSITGLRIDHIDGLYEPEEYLKHLQKEGPDLYLIVEKILIGQEKLNVNWPVAGTSGYDYLNVLNGLFIDSESRSSLQQIYEGFIGFRNRLSEIVCECKKAILLGSMASELTITTRRLEIITEQHRWSYDFAYESLRAALRDVIASFSVYRTYIKIEDRQVNKNDQKIIFKAIKQAKKLNPASDHLVFDFIKSVLFLEDPPGLNEEQIKKRREFVLRFQQLTGPVMAKGFEDTALYRSYPLSSMNEVGMDPNKFGMNIEEFHLENQARLQDWPHSLLTTSTHDTKRSEDVRARINVLSEMAEEWKESLGHWQSLNKTKKVTLDSLLVPDANEEYLLYQTLIGSWPYSFTDDQEKTLYVQRIQRYMQKALKEAKIHTSWINPNHEYEEAVDAFINRILDQQHENPFLTHFQKFVTLIQKAGIWNSLSQLLLKMTAPGIPDFYQGSELFEFTLVDPDNRQPVNFAIQQEKLRMIQENSKINLSLTQQKFVQNIEEGSLKLFLIWRVLNFRKLQKILFEEGDYVPLNVEGEMAKHLVAFQRSYGKKQCIVIVARFFYLLLKKSPDLDPSRMGENTRVNLSFMLQGSWMDVISGRLFNFEGIQKLTISQVFENYPFILLTNLEK